MRLILVFIILTNLVWLVCCQSTDRKLVLPIVINTWNFTSANVRAWQELEADRSALDAIEFGCGQCEIDRCDGTVGWGGSPSETGETTLDAMIMDGQTYDVGAVGGLRRVKNAIKVARMVLERTNHTLLVGEMATQFALELGMKEEPLTSRESREIHESWLQNNCQPNYWKNVSPDPRNSCGPYHLSPLQRDNVYVKVDKLGPVKDITQITEINNFDRASAQNEVVNRALLVGHDTMGMIARDFFGRWASGTSTNGLRFKILGRVGDSPVPGAGSYAAQDAGAAAATGDGDVMMRHLLSFGAVENLRRGMNAKDAARDVIVKQAHRTGHNRAHAAVIVLSRDGSFGAACSGYVSFPFVVSDRIERQRVYTVKCLRDDELN